MDGPSYSFFAVVGLIDSPSALWPMKDPESGEGFFDDPKSIVWVPNTFDYAPKNNHHNQPQSKDGIPTFCFPYGCQLLLEPPQDTTPCFHSFVMTREDGEKSYGGCLKYVKKLNKIDTNTISRTVDTIKAMLNIASPDDAATATSAEEQEEAQSFYTWECIVLMSQFPLVNATKQILSQLYEIANQGSELPFKSYLYNILYECPNLPPGYDINVNLGKDLVRIPGTSYLPSVDFDIREIFTYFSTEGVLKLFSCMLSDERVVILSRDLERLSIVCETLIFLMFPFPWCHPYVPVLPHVMLQFLEAPTPFLMGVERDAFYNNKNDLLIGLVVANCDEATIFCDDDIPALPNLTELETKINKLLSKTDLSSPEFAKQIQAIFINHFAVLMQGYEDFLFLPSDNNFTLFNVTGETYLFDNVAFISEQPAATRKFLSAFCESQALSSFLDAKYESSTVTKNGHIEYFDHIISKKPLITAPSTQVIDLVPPTLHEKYCEGKASPIKFSDMVLDKFPKGRNDVVIPDYKMLSVNPSAPVFLSSSSGSFDDFGSIHRTTTSPRRVSRAVGVVERKLSLHITHRVSQANSLPLPGTKPFNPQSVFIDEIFESMTGIINKLKVSHQDWTKICSDLQLIKNSDELDQKKKNKLLIKDRSNFSRKESLGTKALMGMMKHHEGVSNSHNAEYSTLGPKRNLSTLQDVPSNTTLTSISSDSSFSLATPTIVLGEIEPEKTDGESLQSIQYIQTQLNNQIDTEINKLCSVFETIFGHGCDRGKKGFGTFIFQSDLAKSEVACQDRKRIKNIYDVKTPIGMGRAFVRFCLEKGNLSNHISEILSDESLIKSSYLPFAMLSQPDTLQRLKDVLDPLSNISVNNVPLDANKTQDYNMRFFTSDIFGAGTAAGIKIILIGLLNKTQQIKLSRGPNTFARGTNDTYTIQGNGLGEIIGLAIENDGNALTPSWNLDRVLVECKSTGKSYTFTCRKWIGVNGEIDTVYLSVDKKIKNIQNKECELEIWLLNESFNAIMARQRAKEFEDLSNASTSSLDSYTAQESIRSRPTSSPPTSTNVSPRSSRGNHTRNRSLANRLSGMFMNKETVEVPELAGKTVVDFSSALFKFDACVDNVVTYLQDYNAKAKEDHVSSVLNTKRIFKDQFYPSILELFLAGFRGKRKFFADLSVWDFVLKCGPSIGQGHMTTVENAFKASYELIERCIPGVSSMIKFEVFIYLGLSKNMIGAWVSLMRDYSQINQYYSSSSVFLSPNEWKRFQASLSKLTPSLSIDIPPQLVSDYI